MTARGRRTCRRGVLAQQLLTFPSTGAIAAAATSSLPERIGGDRNWDYRFSWLRDTSLALESLLAVRLNVECQRSLAWVLEASKKQKELQPMYTLTGRHRPAAARSRLRRLPRARAVRIGNDAEDQLQLGGYADILDAAYRFCGAGHCSTRTAQSSAPSSPTRCATCGSATTPASGRSTQHPYTQSKIGCWAALDHAIELAEHGRLPDAARRR